MSRLEHTLIAHGSPELELCDKELDELFSSGLSKALALLNKPGSVLAVVPDSTRLHSRGGQLCGFARRELADRLKAVLPALGTHHPMTAAELDVMYPAIPKDKFIVHDWRSNISELGRLEADWVANVCEGTVRFDWPVQVNRLLPKSGPGSGGFSLILSIGQVVPHEVTGMANHAKNIFVGCGGKEAIDKSHFAGAAYGMERIMGKTDTPVRALFDESLRRFSGVLPPILWVLTVVGPKHHNAMNSNCGVHGVSRRINNELIPKTPRSSKLSYGQRLSIGQRSSVVKSDLVVRGLYMGFGRECFERAAELSRQVNVTHLDEPVHKAVVYLDPQEYRSCWLGNKAIYRTRMAIADGGELLILAPGLRHFGEDPGIDALIRKYGYRSSAEITKLALENADLAHNLAAAAHLIHGSGEGRFTIRYCTHGESTGGYLSQKEMESVGFEWGNLDAALLRYDINTLRPGWNTLHDGEKIFYVENPGLGLLNAHLSG